MNSCEAWAAPAPASSIWRALAMKTWTGFNRSSSVSRTVQAKRKRESKLPSENPRRNSFHLPRLLSLFRPLLVANDPDAAQRPLNPGYHGQQPEIHGHQRVHPYEHATTRRTDLLGGRVSGRRFAQFAKDISRPIFF